MGSAGPSPVLERRHLRDPRDRVPFRPWSFTPPGFCVTCRWALTSMGSPLDAGRRIARLIGAADDAPRVIKAYQGSPHSFSRFDSSKIGTGEGAQAYGHGLYFAGNEGVARTYRDITPLVLPPEAEALNQQIKELFQQRSDLFGELQMAADADNPFVVGRRDINAQPSTVRARVVPQLAAVIQQIADAQGRMQNVLRNRRGHMYEVEIDYPEDALLHLDVPVGEQPKAVRDALGEFARAPSHFTFGQEGWRGKNAYMSAAEQGGSQAEASRFLLERGIPGLRYWDGESRAAGEGTRNYVMFPGTEDRIRILRQYGLLPPLVGAGMMEEE